MKRICIELGIVLSLVAIIAIMWQSNAKLRSERNTYKRNVANLMTRCETYKVRDSLNVAMCGELELSLAEFKKYKKQDAQLIQELKARTRDLERVTAAQTQTITELSTIARDTVILRDSVAIPATFLTIRDKWYDFDGIIENGRFSGQMVNRDSLVVVEFVEKTKCLFKKWRKVKNRTVNVISKNPHTSIRNVEYIVIEKK